MCRCAALMARHCDLPLLFLQCRHDARQLRGLCRWPVELRQTATARLHNLRLRPSRWSNAPRSKSRTNTFVDTGAPPSRRFLAIALSTANPRHPATAHADRWWPRQSSGRPHRQLREDKERGFWRQEQHSERVVRKRGESRRRATRECSPRGVRNETEPEHAVVVAVWAVPHANGFLPLSSMRNAANIDVAEKDRPCPLESEDGLPQPSPTGWTARNPHSSETWHTIFRRSN